ncbi:hypothetical protein BX070DRAFT_233275 [Coemansia spiralis]|nr:hypothetical protein BX070DRAFT_233275 [Coemansia spiralis]
MPLDINSTGAGFYSLGEFSQQHTQPISISTDFNGNNTASSPLCSSGFTTADNSPLSSMLPLASPVSLTSSMSHFGNPTSASMLYPPPSLTRAATVTVVTAEAGTAAAAMPTYSAPAMQPCFSSAEDISARLASSTIRDAFSSIPAAISSTGSNQQPMKINALDDSCETYGWIFKETGDSVPINPQHTRNVSLPANLFHSNGGNRPN